MENADIARTLFEIADILELLGENPFRARAYRRAGQVIDTLSQPASSLWRQDKLALIPGLGPKLVEVVDELLSTGECRERARLAGKVPPGVLEMLQLEGVGPRTAAAIWKHLGITTVEELEAACQDGRLLALPRMGALRARGIAAAIRRHRARAGRTPLHRALAQAETLLARLRQVPGTLRAEAAGSLRRRCETVGDLDLLVATRNPGPIGRAFVGGMGVDQVLAEGPTRCAVRLRSGLHVDLRLVPPESFGAALHYFTGSKPHNVELRTRAVRLGLKISEYGVFDRQGRRLGGEREEDVFQAVGLPFIPPELREGAGEIQAAEAGALPELVEESDIAGDLHVHSAASVDAHSDLPELAAEAARLGRRYLAITDHSRSRPLGLDADGALKQAERVRAHSASAGLPRLLAGVEVDILPDGTLDLPCEVLARLDWVVASVHSRLHDPRPAMTARMLRAIGSGCIDVLGHPSGRILGARDPSDFDLDAVLEAARKHQVAIEVNAQPERLDLSDKACRRAREAGVRVAISSDAHFAGHLANLRYGVWVARRGWLRAEDVLNARGSEPEANAFRKARSRGAVT